MEENRRSRRKPSFACRFTRMPCIYASNLTPGNKRTSSSSVFVTPGYKSHAARCRSTVRCSRAAMPWRPVEQRNCTWRPRKHYALYSTIVEANQKLPHKAAPRVPVALPVFPPASTLQVVPPISCCQLTSQSPHGSWSEKSWLFCREQGLGKKIALAKPVATRRAHPRRHGVDGIGPIPRVQRGMGRGNPAKTGPQARPLVKK